MAIKRKQALLYIAIAALALFAVYHFFGQKTGDVARVEKQDAKPQDSKPKVALTVNVVKPQQTELTNIVPANGSVAAWQEAIIGVESNGLMLKEVLVNVGDTVKRGQVLARFSISTIEADLAQAQANVADAKAAAIEAASTASRARSIQETGALSAQQIEQYISQEASTKARLQAAEANVAMQNIKRGQTVVISPDAGIISARSATVGAVANAGQELFKLVRQGRLEWRAELTSADVTDIKTGMAANITLPNGDVLTGKVRAVSPVVDSQTRNAIVYVDMPASSAKLGMFARGNFQLGTSNASTLPSSAVVLRDGFSYVMKVEADGHVRQLKVETGKRKGEQVEILNLTSTDDSFVASGGAFLADGDVVKVVQAHVKSLKVSP